ncbi:E3 SUMO-protein ligase ZBED1-like [Portunus trituberculatus]|uniref:E3 SUMO-protein ligase ZBED1-like n=1 Tax=Portunus trituberculatus TaxID=210409 RepID=UPI001E1D0815|nr:E3 SUMO-protein ligase ZBED1-like [Portunus trituberculatus]
MATKRSRKAPVWTYMDQVEPNTVVCLVCKDTLKYTGGTSSMMKHIRTKHPLEYADLKEDSEHQATAAGLDTPSTSTVQPTLMEAISKTQVYKKDSNKKKELDHLLLRMIVKDMQPLTIVENEGFTDYSHGLNPRYELPSRRELTRTLLPLLYKNESEKVKKELSTSNYISLTTDIWTSRQTMGYITVTAHFISPEWTLRSVVLATARMTNSHTKENIAEEITRICNEWDILHKRTHNNYTLPSRQNDMCTTSEELELIQNTVVILEPFKELTKEMSAEKFVSLSKVIPIVRGMQAYMNASNGSEAQQRYSSNPLGIELKQQMSKRFPCLESALCLGAATLLDPRFKKIPFADKSLARHTEDRLINLMQTKASDEAPSTTTAVLPAAQQVLAQKSCKTPYWNTFDTESEKIVQTTSQLSTGPRIELKRYFEENHISRDGDPLAWWKEHDMYFPKLSDLAKRFLCTSASSVPSERLFSKAGELISHRRSNIKDTNVNMILFLNKNAR